MNKRAVIDIAVVFGLILATIWLAPRLSDDPVAANHIGWTQAIAALVTAIASTILRGDRLGDLGLRFDNFLAAFRLVVLPTLVFAVVILAVGTGCDSLHFSARLFPQRLDRYLWPFIQQYLLLGFLNRRLQNALGKGQASAVVTAMIFAGMHAPNLTLMIATFTGGCIWAWTFQRQPNLFATTLSHILLGAVLGHSLPAWMLPNMKVGWGYWH